MGLFETTAEELYQIAISKPLFEKVDNSIALIREYEPMALELSPDGYYVAFSGGKDSIVMAKLFEMSGVKHQLWYNNVTIDPPELVRFIKKQYPHAKWNNPKKHLCSEIVNHSPGLPTRRGRWCCEIYKEGGGKGHVKSLGVRTEESKRRKGLWTEVRISNEGPTICPILYWTKKDIWEFIKIENMSYCSLYDEGFDRLGCVGCPLGNRKRKIEFSRWPKYEKLWRKGGMAWWEKYRVMTKPNGEQYFAAKFKTFDEYWSWWMEEKNIDDTDQPDCQLWLW